MLYFPQLSTGALSQYPVVKRLVRRTALNTQADGRVWKLGDAAAKTVLWKLTYQGLTTEEVAALTTLFDAAEGRLSHFTFLDPTDNLLSYSEAPGGEAWTRDPLLTVAGSIADPEGGTRASRLTNSGQADQKLQQTIDAPAQLHYCFSFYVRSDYAVAGRATVTGGTASATLRYPVTRNWRRVVYPVRLSTAADSVTFAIVLDAGLTLDVFGMQVEAQVAPSLYKPTYGRGGVYNQARFDEDEITVTAEGPGRHSCALQIVAGLEG